MNCVGCQFLGTNCGGIEGNPGSHTVDPLSLSSRQLFELACAVARIGTVICDLGRAGPDALQHSLVGDDMPYIWDIIEED